MAYLQVIGDHGSTPHSVLLPVSWVASEVYTRCFGLLLRILSDSDTMRLPALHGGEAAAPEAECAKGIAPYAPAM